MQKTFIKYLLLFFLPVVLINLALEYQVRSQAGNYKANAAYLSKSGQDIEVLVLGSSQAKDAVNPEWISKSTFNLASGNQHHDTDFELLKGVIDRLPQLETVVFEVSYSHFELPHNGPKFWKNSAYLHFYDVNAYRRPVYFKDELIFLSNPQFFVRQFFADSTANSMNPKFNAFGFDTNNFAGQFRAMDYDRERIDKATGFKINRTPNKALFNKQAVFFEDMVAYARSKGLKVVIMHVPMYKTYHHQKNPQILMRRDSLIDRLIKQYPDIQLLDKERDTLNYSIPDFWNQSHLNPRGAQKFSRSLDSILNS